MRRDAADDEEIGAKKASATQLVAVEMRYRERLMESVFAGALDADAGRVMDSDTVRERLAQRRAARDDA